jgi:hypothetical protein
MSRACHIKRADGPMEKHTVSSSSWMWYCKPRMNVVTPGNCASAFSAFRLSSRRIGPQSLPETCPGRTTHRGRTAGNDSSVLGERHLRRQRCCLSLVRPNVRRRRSYGEVQPRRHGGHGAILFTNALRVLRASVVSSLRLRGPQRVLRLMLLPQFETELSL